MHWVRRCCGSRFGARVPPPAQHQDASNGAGILPGCTVVLVDACNVRDSLSTSAVVPGDMRSVVVTRHFTQDDQWFAPTMQADILQFDEAGNAQLIFRPPHHQMLGTRWIARFNLAHFAPLDAPKTAHTTADAMLTCHRPPCETRASPAWDALDRATKPFQQREHVPDMGTSQPGNISIEGWDVKSFIETGYGVIKEVLDLETVTRARDFVLKKYVKHQTGRFDGGRQIESPGEPVLNDLLYNSPAWVQINAMLGGRAKKMDAGVFIQYPGPRGDADADIAPYGGHIDAPPCSVLLIGIALTGSDAAFTGNFCYFPKSHTLVANACRSHPEGFGNGINGFDNFKRFGVPIEKLQGKAQQAVVGPKDVYFAHYNTIHFGGPNWQVGIPRVALYYRIAIEDYDHIGHYATDMPELWKHFKGLQ